MKIRIGKERPVHFREEYPGQFEIVSHMECAAGVPQVLFAITTWKENGQAQRVLPLVGMLPRG